MKKAFNYFLHSFIFLLLTGLTQIGGVLYVICVFLTKKWKPLPKFNLPVVFIGVYLLVTFFVLPFVAPLFGREKVKHSHTIQPTNYMTVILNRNYVKPELNELLQKTEIELKGTEIKLNYLDANFPFIDRFPLPPHLSHNDGRKIDLSLVFENQEEEISPSQKSVSGYGVFEEPLSGENNKSIFCKDKGYFQYDYSKYLSFGTINKELKFSEKGTKTLLESLLKNPSLQKLFIEPHLKKRMNLTDNKIRFHGCGAVRHDDHIHIQIK